MYNAKESTVTVGGMSFPYISFGKGKKSLIMIQGLNTRGIQGAALSLAYMYRIFAKEYTVYLFDRRPIVQEGITVSQMASDIAAAMDALGTQCVDLAAIGADQPVLILRRAIHDLQHRQ